MPSTPSNTIPRYRAELKKVLPPHYLKPDNRHLFWFFPHAAIIAGGIWLMTAWFTWWLAPILSIVIGHSFACLAFLAHEICHGGSIPNKKLRHFLAGVAFSPFAIGAHLWSRWHNATHHNHTQHHELDPDRLFTISEYKNGQVLKALHLLPRVMRNFVVFSYFTLLMSQHNITMGWTYLRDPAISVGEKLTIAWQFLLPKALWIGGTLMLGWPILLFGYLVPLMVANFVVISYIATNHFLNPLADENDVLATSLSVTMPKGLRWLDPLHLRFGAHVSHHLFPQAPTRYSRQIELEIARLWPDRYHVMPITKALNLLWNTPWIYDEDGKGLLDPKASLKAPTLGHGLENR